ncbi:MAG: hypothetical protein ACO3MB_13115 [Saprospiraceae bacterium]
MNQERYWRNLIADEIKAEHDKVKKYYQKKGMNTGGMSPEEHTRLNIFLLSESIARTMKNSQDAPRLTTPEPEPAKVEEVIEQPVIEEKVEQIDGQMTLEDITIKDVVPDLVPEVIPDPMPDPIQSLVKDTPYQNEFGEIL